LAGRIGCGSSCGCSSASSSTSVMARSTAALMRPSRRTCRKE